MNAFEGTLNYSSLVVTAEDVATEADMAELLRALAAMPLQEKVRSRALVEGPPVVVVREPPPHYYR